MKNFAILFYFVLLGETFVFVSSTVTDSNDECKQIVNKSPRVRLRKYLFCNYVWSDRGNSDNVTVVKIEILPKFAKMDEHHSNLELNTWMYITWKDERLTWDPSRFDYLRRFSIHSNDIWIPDISVQSSGNNNVNENGLANSDCEVSSDGSVGCVPRNHHTIGCQSDFTLWPYDRQNCTLFMSSWKSTQKQMIFEPLNSSNKTVFMFDFIVNPQWHVTVPRITYEIIATNYSESLAKLSIDFVLDRTHGQLSARFIMPCILISIITLTTLWLDPRSNECLGLACTNPIVHLFCIHDLNWVLPHSCNIVPNIVLFYTNSFVLSIFALVLTIFLGKLCETKIPAPKWISSPVSLLLRNKFGQIMLLDILDPKISADVETDAEDNDNLVNSNAKKFSWIYVVVFLSWLIFFTFFFTYVLMWIILIPSPSMKSPMIDMSGKI